MEREAQTHTPVIRVSAIVLRDADGAVLTVRKRGTTRFMLPGGKPEPGETPEATALRECAEEVGAELPIHDLRLLGIFRAAAANEAGHTVEATVYEHPARIHPRATREIAELRWTSLDVLASAPDVAPLLQEHVAPALRARPRS